MPAITHFWYSICKYVAGELFILQGNLCLSGKIPGFVGGEANIDFFIHHAVVKVDGIFT